MIALDANILVRLVIGDDPAQARRVAARIDGGEAFFVPLTVSLELEWLLRGAYGLSRERVVSIFETLLSIRNLRFADEQALGRALKQHRLGLDFADALRIVSSHGCTAMLSFDGRLRARARRAQLPLAVEAP